MKAWEMAQELFSNARPVIRQEEEQTWTDNVDVSVFYDDNLSLDWGSNVPGSGAPEKIMVASIQALENRGYQVSDEGYRLLEEGLKAHEKKDFVALHAISALLRRELANAKKDPQSDYWKYMVYESFEQYEKAVTFPEAIPVDVHSERFAGQIRGSWLSQMIGGAMGTMVEGYTSGNLKEAFGDVTGYLREPNTYNDDITFELAFLDAFSRKGYEVTSEDIALSWVGLIPCGWSAEELAIRNIKNGIFPPQSGTFHNPFNEWIGAQMRAGVCGMAAPGDPYLAASLAWRDGEVSHANNGILGEVFNAVMTSLAFVETDITRIVELAIQMIPADSEYYSVVSFAWDCCHKYETWQEALADCQQKYKKYNWIHAYPNACCEVIALLYGKGDFKETLHIITMCGIDVDCNAGMIMPILTIQQGMGIIPNELLHPAFSRLETYMRGRFASISLDELVDDTLCSIKNATCTNKRRNEQ
jgi:ADP-ribosylglycohydrolase